MKPLLVSSGEPAGIGPNLCLYLDKIDYPLVILGDKELLESRAKNLGLNIQFNSYEKNVPILHKPGTLTVLSHQTTKPVQAGILNPDNAQYVIDLLTIAAKKTKEQEFTAIVTAPVHKGIINQAGIDFTGHTEFFADYFGEETVVMVLACEQFKVALLTTHLALKSVPDAITPELLEKIITKLSKAFQTDFGITNPKIAVAGLNPHAGESGYLGREEIDIIEPTLNNLRKKGFNLTGPLSADTLFSAKNMKEFDVFLTMYHDQGLPVIKYASFGAAVNVTLGLPIIRTSVDHGTALELANTKSADPSSLIAAVTLAIKMIKASNKT